MDDNEWHNRSALGLEFNDKNIKRLENLFKRKGIEQYDWLIYTKYLEEKMNDIPFVRKNEKEKLIQTATIKTKFLSILTY